MQDSFLGDLSVNLLAVLAYESYNHYHAFTSTANDLDEIGGLASHAAITAELSLGDNSKSVKKVKIYGPYSFCSETPMLFSKSIFKRHFGIAFIMSCEPAALLAVF